MKRIESLDCLKWFAIAMVVIGHFVDVATSHSENYRSIYLFIYSFHMPLFIFLSGLFDHPRKRFPASQVLFFLVMFVLLKLLIFATDGLLTGTPSFNLFVESGIPWFMLSLAIWKTVSFFLNDSSPKIILPLTIVLALAYGYQTTNPDLLCISRTIVFFPFYYAGFILTTDQVSIVLASKKMAVAGILLIFTFATLCFLLPETTYKLRMLFTGRNPYSIIPIENCGWVHRLFCYLISALLCASFISVFSQLQFPSAIAKLGQRTLSVYFWHWPILSTLCHIGLSGYLLGKWPGGYIWIAVAIVVTLICSAKFAQSPIDYVKQHIKIE